MSLVSGNIPAVPLSQLTSPLEAGTPAAEDSVNETVVIPPAFAGQGRGFSALNFGLTPPANNGASEAGLQSLKDALDEIRFAVDDAEARTEASVRLSALDLSNEELVDFAEELAELNVLVDQTIPEGQQQVAAASDVVTARQTDVNTSQAALQQAEDALAAADPESPELEQLRQDVDDARAQLANAEIALAAAETSKTEAENALNADEERAEQLRTETVPQALAAVGLAKAAVPELSKTTDDNLATLLSDLVGEESFARIVHDIVANTETNLYDVAIVKATLEDAAQELGEVRNAKVGLAFSTIFATLQEALNAIAEGSDLALSSVGALSRNGEDRVRLPLDGAF